LTGALDDHDGVVDGTVHLGEELLSTSTKDDGDGLGLGTAAEDVVALASKLTLLEKGASSQHRLVEIVDGGLDLRSAGLAHARQVL